MKNILLAVCGLAPQVVTETLYALLHEGRQVHAVHVITTRIGRDKVNAGLFGSDCHRLGDLLSDFGLNRAELEFNSSSIHTLKNENGIELDDIITPEDNEILLRTCLDLTFSFASEPDTAIWFLVAGGRKTMTSCLTLAAQLYGRPQDRLLHVLVSPEFENCRDFWYPPKESAVITLHDDKGQPYYKDSRYAKIQLVNIPFVSVRHLFSSEMLDQPRPPAELMQSLIRDTPKRLTIKLADGKIVYGGMELDMHPSRLALYAFFVEQKKNCRLEKSCAGCEGCFLDASEVVGGNGVAVMYARIPGGRLLSEMSDTGIGSLSKENFNSYKSKIRKDLLQAFGQAHIEGLEISACGDRPETRYGIRLDRKLIRLEW
ncbi:MAG: TIGR02584 family CRISPR-associated protein [Desulfamplus sp.]|nr:TIGR02584 family CRISPR-associated protein [Desulfamplus sp.]